MHTSSRLPSVARIEKSLNISNAIACEVRAQMETAQQQRHKLYTCLGNIDQIIGTHGVDSFTGMSYCNAGDPYKTTVIYIENRANYGPCKGFVIGCWGYYVEKFPALFK